MGHRFMYELGLALGFIACVVIVLKWAGTELIHSIFPPKDDKETKAVTEVQEPEKREEPSVSTATDDTTTDQPLVIEVGPEPYQDSMSQSTSEPEVSYESETSSELSDYDATKTAIAAALNNMSDEAIDAQLNAAGTDIGLRVVYLTASYVEENEEYLNAANISTQDVMDLSDAILAGMSVTDDILNPEDPDHSSVTVSSYDGLEIYSIIFTLNSNGGVDIDMTLNESGYMEALTNEVDKLAYERNQ